ncbi:M14 family metallopeptidase [Aquabacterium sp. A7-Y]|uniref:DUF2817 domain-containing protein n=1 Tax=Aquabacterium sp. A7-Y TaxID=1349605 RepID=UPI00223DDB03|nr:DUF2817 domain-containing protein [Aquabacterium sp. A7-Y]MCW7538208.1 M14 family metallopeptidase [Aquabacterium sp. A7-Y]
MISEPGTESGNVVLSQSHVEVREKFLSAVKSAGLEAQSQIHPQRGRAGETQVMDAARFGADEAGVAVLYLHALNPYGFSSGRRTTHENVDRNCNFHDFCFRSRVVGAAVVSSGSIFTQVWGRLASGSGS